MAFAKINLSLLVAGLTFAATVLPVSIVHSAEENAPTSPFRVLVDRAKVVRIATPADTIIIGNPAILDAAIQDSNTLVLTGRSYGVTNLIVLDKDGEPVVDETIVVEAPTQHTVRVYRRAVRETLACSPNCHPTITMGDDKSVFQINQSQANDHKQRSQSAAQE